jgi:uncharacterized protein
VSELEPPLAWSSLRAYVADGGRAAVLLSGGVDSAVVAHLAHAALGSEAVAVTLVGPSISEAEVDRARRVAGTVGISHAIVPVDPLANAEYRSNPSNRCYFCRSTEVAALRGWAADHGVRQLVDGVHLDDLGDARAGLRALDEAGVRHPLLWGRWRKAQVRSHAREVGLPNWDVPSDACLASRVAHGNPITAVLLRRVERAEEGLRARGFRRVRVRTDGALARVEVDPHEVARLLEEPTASQVRRELAEFGFAPVELDPAGYRPRAGG